VSFRDAGWYIPKTVLKSAAFSFSLGSRFSDLRKQLANLALEIASALQMCVFIFEFVYQID